MIKGGKIKETIFCYWSFLYEENLNLNNIKNRNIVPQKVIITDKSIEEYKKNITLKVDNKQGYDTEITLVEIKKFIQENNSINLEKWKKYLDNYDKDILFLGLVCID